jgi:hypothetical protein
LWRDRWRWLARRWAFALAGFAAGLLGVGGWQFHELEALWETEAQVEDLRKKLHAHIQQSPTNQASGVATALTAPMGPPRVMAGWPVQGTQTTVWPQVERRMVQHGLRLLSLQLEPLSDVGGWPSQAVALRLQGRFEDWVAVWTALNARGPFWGIERLRITPLEAEVAVDAVLRLWLSPEAAGTPSPAQTGLPTDLMMDDVPVAPRIRAGAPVFVPTAAPPATSPIVMAGLKAEVPMPGSAGLGALSNTVAKESRAPIPPPTMLSPDPADWPLDQVRLMGVWQSEQDVQLILQAGSHWVPARVGQRIGPNGHVVHGIHAQEVHLRAAQGAVWVISLEKAKP